MEYLRVGSVREGLSGQCHKCGYDKTVSTVAIYIMLIDQMGAINPDGIYGMSNAATQADIFSQRLLIDDHHRECGEPLLMKYEGSHK